jgi:hypothetical protein
MNQTNIQMLITKEDARKMDTILSYLVKNENARMKLKQIMDLLNTSLEDARYLYELLLKYHGEVEPVISIHQGSNIAKKPRITEDFLKRGGFADVYEQQANIKAFNEPSQLKKKKNHNFYNCSKYSYWFIFIMVIVSFIMALISLFISLKIIQID